MTHFDVAKRVAIEVPTAEVGFVLERRLSLLRPTLVGAEGEWRVELTDDDDQLAEIVATVRHWLRDEHLDGTTLYLDGRPHYVRAAKRHPRTAHATGAS